MTRFTRHWKQVFDKDADFIFTRAMTLSPGKRALPGDDVPKDICTGHRARIWWNAGVIALKHWDYKNGCPMPPQFTYLGYGWYQVAASGKKVRKKNLEAALAEAAA